MSFINIHKSETHTRICRLHDEQIPRLSSIVFKSENESMNSNFFINITIICHLSVLDKHIVNHFHLPTSLINSYQESIQGKDKGPNFLNNWATFDEQLLGFCTTFAVIKLFTETSLGNKQSLCPYPLPTLKTKSKTLCLLSNALPLS